MTNEQLVLRRAERTESRDEARRLEQIGFPLAVRAEKKMLPPGKFERGKPYIAKMPEGEFAQAHPPQVVSSQ
jgi:hypothetical protein